MLETGELAAAVEEYGKGLASEPDNAAARANLGFALLRLDRADEAAVQLAEAVRRDPKSVDARSLLAEALDAAQRGAAERSSSAREGTRPSRAPSRTTGP
jgi:predicted Zn-dependent protease